LLYVWLLPHQFFQLFNIFSFWITVTVWFVLCLPGYFPCHSFIKSRFIYGWWYKMDTFDENDFSIVSMISILDFLFH
jgi:hypothetical protein